MQRVALLSYYVIPLRESPPSNKINIVYGLKGLGERELSVDRGETRERLATDVQSEGTERVKKRRRRILGRRVERTDLGSSLGLRS